MADFDISSYVTKQIESRSADFGTQIRTTAKMLHTFAEQLRDDAMTHNAAALADRGADMIDRLGTYFETADLSTMTADAEDFSRKRPWAAASVGIAAGVFAARLLKSTASRRHSGDEAAANGS